MPWLKDEKQRTLSSRTWLERQLRDPYVMRAKREGFRSRAAYKLAEIDDKYHVLKAGARVVDLGAAPGGWSEIAVRRVGADGRVIALDILDFKPDHGELVGKLFKGLVGFEMFLEPGESKFHELNPPASVGTSSGLKP